MIGAGSLERAQGNLEEARQLLEQALNVYRELRDEVGTARALDELGSIAYLKCDFQMGESLCRQSLALYRRHYDLEGVASSLFSMGHWATTRGLFRESDSHLKECLALCKSLGFVQGQGAALASIARLRLHLGDAEMASRLASQALEYSARIRDDWNIGFIELVSGEAARHRNDLDLADRHLLASLNHFKTRGDQWGFARSMRCMASVKRMRGQMQPARSLLQHSMTICKSLESHWDLAQALEEQAHLVIAEEQNLEAAMISLGAAQELRDTVGAPLPPVDQAALFSIVERAKTELGEAQTSSCLKVGRSRALAEIKQSGLGQTNQARKEEQVV